MNVYLDNAATTPLDPEVLEAMLPYLNKHFGNPSAVYSYGREARAAIEQARKTVAEYLHCAPSEIFFTSGGTEANNMVLRGAVEAQNIRHIVTTPLEHHCVTHTLDHLQKCQAVEVHYLEVDGQGLFSLDQLKSLLERLPAPVLVCLMHANNELGTLINLEEVGDVVRHYGGILHSDTVQTVAHLPLALRTMAVHFITGSAHKFHGPKGVGFVYVRHGTPVRPLLLGGSQERNMRAGTENVSGIVGMVRALQLAYDHLDEVRTHIDSLRRYMWQQLQQEGLELVLNTPLEQSLYTILNIAFPRTDQTSLLLLHLDLAGICASSGSACSSGSEQHSHVMQAIGLDSRWVPLRFSFSKYNTQGEVDYTVETLKKIVQPTTVH